MKQWWALRVPGEGVMNEGITVSQAVHPLSVKRRFWVSEEFLDFKYFSSSSG